MKTFVARRRLEMQPGVWREPDQLVPEAYTWFRLDSWLHTGYLVEVEASEDEFRAAVAQFCPQLSETVLGLAGLDPDVALEGERKTPRKRTKAPAEAPAETPELVALKDTAKED